MKHVSYNSLKLAKSDPSANNITEDKFPQLYIRNKKQREIPVVDTVRSHEAC